MWGRGDRTGGALATAAVTAMLALLGLLALAFAATPSALATHGAGGANECDDNVDNDFDLMVDHDGGPFGPLLKDPNCSGPDDDSEHASSTCGICVNFYTEYDRDGPGGAAPVKRYHQNLYANVPYSLDVNGNLGDLAGGLAIPGYEIRVVVEGLSATNPTIRIQKLATAPLDLPLRTEIVIGEATKTSLGYDTLDSTAPQSWVAAIDLGDRDGNVNTSQALVNLTIGGPGRRLTLVTEEFGGHPIGGRTDRHIRRATLIGDPARGTVVPSSASLDLTSSPTRTGIHLTHSERTTLEFALDEPGDGTDASGRVDELPATVDVDLADVDLNGDGALDNSLAFEGSAGVGHLDVHIDSAKTEKAPDGTTTVVGRQTVDGEVTDLPAVAGLTYADTANRTDVTYNSEGRATRAEIRTDDGGRQFEAAIDNLPENILGLTHFTNATGGSVEYSSDGIADHAHVFTKEGPKELEVDVDGLPANIPELSYDTPEDLLDIHYEADSTAPHVTVRTQDLIEPGPPDPGEEPTPNHLREMTVAADGVPGELDFTLDTTDPNGEMLADWFASSTLPRIRVTGTDEVPFFQRATDLDLLVEDLPRDVSARVREDLIDVDAGGDQIGRVELHAAARGDTERLPSNADGMLTRDTAARYVLFARVRGLRDFTYSKETSSSLDIGFDATPPAGTLARIDSVADVTDEVWDNDPENDGGEVERDGLEVTQLVLEDYPADVQFHIDTGNEVQGTVGEIEVDYTAASTAGPMSFGNVVTYEGDPVPVTYEHQYAADRFGTTYPVSDFNSHLFATLTPMPSEFSVCKVASGDDCNEFFDGTVQDIFTDGLFEDFDPDNSNNGGSVRFTSVPEANFTLDQQDTEPLEVGWIRFADEVDEADDECENPVLNIICRYFDVKPGLKTASIDLDLNDLVIQSHLESSGWVGHNVADLFGDGDNQGYVAFDTGWRNVESITGAELCAIFDQPDDCLLGQFFHGHFPPPADVQTEGLLAQGGEICTQSQDCNAITESFPLGWAGETKPVSLNFGTNFGAAQRVFEFDPDELIFAEHHAGHVYCGAGTDLTNGSSSFTDYICDNHIALPPP